jgi:hypothetical protein
MGNLFQIAIKMSGKSWERYMLSGFRTFADKVSQELSLEWIVFQLVEYLVYLAYCHFET